MKPTLHEKPGYRPISDTDVALDGDAVYEDDNYIIRIYKGFSNDGGSLKWWMSLVVRILPFDPRVVYSFFFHDFIYRTHLLSRKIGDRILWNIQAMEPAPKYWQRWTIWICLRAGGWKAYNEKTPASIKEARKFGEVTKKRTLAPMVIK
jgi:hypothetical protein